MWLKSPLLTRQSVFRSKYATSWLMRQVQYIAPRIKTKKGSGMEENNTIKMNLVLHIAEDILTFGVPENVNSSFSESSHIPISKVTGRNTQKRPKTFTLQLARRYAENIAILHRGKLMIDQSLQVSDTAANGDISTVGSHQKVGFDNYNHN